MHCHVLDAVHLYRTVLKSEVSQEEWVRRKRERERNEASALWLGVSFLLEIKFVAELLQMDSSVFRSYLRLNCSHVTDSSVFTQSFTTDVSTKSQRISFSRRFDVKLAVKLLNPALDLLWYNMWDECRKTQRGP